jgi:uncharacterized protein YukE
MAQVIVSPKDQRVFAQELQDLSRRISNAERQLSGELKGLESVWADEHARRFTKSHQHMAQHLGTFYKAAGRYVAFLNDKAHLGEKYLRSGR